MGTKAARKMLVKLIKGVNFTKILQATFFVIKCFAHVFFDNSLALYFLG
jgi:hypothetical protein